MSEQAATASFDSLTRYLRLQRYAEGDFVGFAFAIGSPEVMVDLGSSRSRAKPA